MPAEATTCPSRGVPPSNLPLTRGPCVGPSAYKHDESTRCLPSSRPDLRVNLQAECPAGAAAHQVQTLLGKAGSDRSSLVGLGGRLVGSPRRQARVGASVPPPTSLADQTDTKMCAAIDKAYALFVEHGQETER